LLDERQSVKSALPINPDTVSAFNLVAGDQVRKRLHQTALDGALQMSRPTRGAATTCGSIMSGNSNGTTWGASQTVSLHNWN
jgi:hypothetical protein